MSKKILTLGMLVAFFFTSCKETPKQETSKQETSKQETNKQDVSVSNANKETNPLIGSWIEPIPGQEKKVQGIKINDDGTAESINMATLLYKKWWEKDGKLILVSESIGNHSSGIDTLEYKIVVLNNTDLELKDGNYSLKYKRQ